MATINIAGLTPVNDPAYRYKMPRITGKVEGRGNGIKTVLTNITDVADALKREAPEITKFFGCELGAQTSYGTDDRAIVNGAHRDADLQSHLSRYIENFVLCKNCRLPETHYKIKDGVISQKCLACGSKDIVDMTHKLTTFILAQYKKNKDLKKKEEKEAGKEEKKKDKKEKKSKEEKSSKSKDGEDEQPTEGKKSKSKKSSSEDGEPNSPTVPENVFGITKESIADAVDDETDDKVAEEGIERFKFWLKSHPEASIADQLEELRNIQTMSSLTPSFRCIIYLGGLFTEQAVAGNEVAKFVDVLKGLAPTEIQQRHLLAAFEWLCGRRFPERLTKLFPKLLMQLYDAEVIDEDIFLAWAGDTTRNEYTFDESMISFDTLETLHQNAAPFIKWLQEAEEEGDEEDDEEEGEDEEGEEEDA